MDQKNQFLSAPTAARTFGFFVDGQWTDGAEHFERASPGHAAAVRVFRVIGRERIDIAVDVVGVQDRQVFAFSRSRSCERQPAGHKRRRSRSLEYEIASVHKLEKWMR